MQYLQKTFQSRQYRPNPNMCCEKCAFGTGEHSFWCMEGVKELEAIFTDDSDVPTHQEVRRLPKCVTCGSILTVSGNCEYCGGSPI